MLIKILSYGIPQTVPPGVKGATVNMGVNLFILQLPSHSRRRFPVQHKTGHQNGVQHVMASDAQELYNEASWLASLVWCKAPYTLSVKLSDFTV
jgi:hypothetical protein